MFSNGFLITFLKKRFRDKSVKYRSENCIKNSEFMDRVVMDFGPIVEAVRLHKSIKIVTNFGIDF